MRYFFVTYRIHKGDMSVEWCPTNEMTGCLWTKPDQGSSFNIFRYLIMGVMPQTNSNNGKQGNRKRKQTNKINQE